MANAVYFKGDKRKMTDIEHAKKYAEESISLAISMYNPKAEIIAETACLYGLTFKNERITELEKENAELKSKVDLSIDCEKAQKNGKLCLGYGGDEDEPCEQCKNCIKCECGYYQLGETEKDDQLTKAKEIIEELLTDNSDEKTRKKVLDFLYPDKKGD
jgi:hypothetical protein